MTQPTLFISHKHSDAAIAKEIAHFVEKLGDIKVHLSSSPEFEGPKFGPNLNAQLRQALWKTDVLILVYTTADENWSYCMWECGVATQQNSPNTNIIVLQCGRDVPGPFEDVLRVNAHSFDDIKKLTHQLVRDPEIFPSLGRAIRDNVKDSLVNDWAREFHEKLVKLLPGIPDLADDWSAWPYIRVELPKTELDAIRAANAADRRSVVQDKAVVIDSDKRAPDLFGRGRFSDRMPLAELAAIWKDQMGRSAAPWFESCCAQIASAALSEIPVIGLNAMRKVGADLAYTPVVSRVQSLPFAKVVRFDIDFYNLADPRAIQVTSRMLGRCEFFSHRIDHIDALTLMALVAELEQNGRNRLPVLDANDCPLYIIHRSMLDKFIARHALSHTGRSARELTVADLLADDEMRRMFENTFATVSENASLADARNAMVAKPGCSDVFVTASGARNEPVLGWLTNIDITKSA